MTDTSPTTHTNTIQPKSTSWWLIIVFLVWVFGIIITFYVVQKPFPVTDVSSLFPVDRASFGFSFTALGRTLLDLGTGLWLWSVNIGVGLRLIRWVGLQKGRQINHGEQLLIAGGLGFGAVGLLVLVLGLIGFIQPAVLFAFAVTLSIITLPIFVSTIRQFRLPPAPFLLKLYLGLTISLALSIALLPPTDWDGLFYHLTGPKQYLAAGRIQPGIDIPHLNFPSLFEMQFMLAMGIRGATAAKLLHFGFSVLLATLVYQTARRHLGLNQGRWAVLLLFSMPMVLTLAGWAYNDLALAFYQVGALYCFLNINFPKYQNTKVTNNWLLLSGLFCGLAMSLKYTSFVAPVTIVLLLLWYQWKLQTSLLTVFKSLLIFSLPALLIASPWYLKNWIFTGNPLYPFVFDGLYWDEFRANAYSGAGTGIGFDLWTWLTLPYQLTLGIRDANYNDGRTGPLFLAYLPLILTLGLTNMRRNAPHAFSACLIFALAQYAFWMLGVVWSQALWQSRLLLPAFVALSPALAWVLHDLRRLNHPQFSLQRFLYLIIGLVMVLGLVDQVASNQVQAGWLHYRPWQYLIGQEEEATYLTRRLGIHYAALAEMNAQLPTDATVVFLWEPRSFYCQPNCQPDSILDRFGHLAYLHESNAESVAQSWRTQGVTHLLIHRLGYNFLLADENTPAPLRPNVELLKSLETNHLDLVFDLAGGYQVYRLK